MLDFIPEWVVHVVALALVAAVCLPHLLRGFRLHRYRHFVLGGPSDVLPHDPSSRYADYYQQLTELGFVPLGIFREKVILKLGEKEYTFYHPQHECRAAVYCLAGGDPRVAFTSDFVDGKLVRTMNYEGEDITTSDYVMRRVPTHKMKKLLDTHLHARYAFVNAGHQLRAAGTLEDWGQAEADAFYHPIPNAQYLTCERTIAFSFVSTLAMLGAASAFCLKEINEIGFATAFSLSVILLTLMGLAFFKFAISRELSEMSTHQSDCDAGVEGRRSTT